MTRKYRSKIRQRTFQNFMAEARLLRDKNILTDFILECEDDVFPVHKMVLAASSPYFRDYFNNQEHVQQTRMNIDFTQSKILKIILEYFYTGRIIIKEKQSQELLKNLLETSTIFQNPFLGNCCLEMLLNKSCRNISLLDWKSIEELNSEIINNIFLANILKKVKLFNELDVFLQCTFSQIDRLLFGSEARNCEQSVILQSILNWVKYESDNRKQYLNIFLDKIDFDKISSAVLLNFKDEYLLVDNTLFLSVCTKCLFKQVENTKKKVKSALPKKKQNTENQNNNMLQINSAENSFASSVNLNVKKYGFSDIVNNGGKLNFFICGDKFTYPGVQIYIYEYASDKLKRMITHPLYSMKISAVLAYKDNIYTVCGYSERNRVIYLYNWKTEEWKEKSYLRTFRPEATAVALNGYIYITGGNTSSISQLVERYDPESNDSKYVATLPAINKSEAVPLIAVNDCLYAWLQMNLYKYLPAEDKWYLETTQLQNKLQTEDIHLATGNDRIFIIKKVEPNSVWIYDPKDKTLTEDFVPSILKECEGILNLSNTVHLEFLVCGSGKWFLYRPLLHSWNTFDPKKLKEFKFSLLTLFPS